jgi:hypothetical protein
MPREFDVNRSHRARPATQVPVPMAKLFSQTHQTVPPLTSDNCESSATGDDKMSVNLVWPGERAVLSSKLVRKPILYVPPRRVSP